MKSSCNLLPRRAATETRPPAWIGRRKARSVSLGSTATACLADGCESWAVHHQHQTPIAAIRNHSPTIRSTSTITSLHKHKPLLTITNDD